MPFTFAHPAAVLPLHRRWPRPFVLSALVIGSMAPDFAYLPPFLASRAVSHNLAGSVLFCVPVANNFGYSGSGVCSGLTGDVIDVPFTVSGNFRSGRRSPSNAV